MQKSFSCNRKNAALLITFISLSALLFSCKPKVYEVLVSDELFELSQKNNFFKEEARSPDYSSGNAFEIYTDEKIIINAVTEDAVTLLKKKPLHLASIYTDEYFGKNYTSTAELLTVEIENTYYFPCIPFSEDVKVKWMPYSECRGFLTPEEEAALTAKNAASTSGTLSAKDDSSADKDKSSKKDNSLPEPLLLELTNIPHDYIAVPLNKGTDEEPLPVYADSQDYPLYRSLHANCRMLPVPEKTAGSKKKTEAFVNAQNLYVTVFANNFFCALPKKIDRPEVITVAAAGDIMLARGVEDLLIKEQKPEAVFTDATPVLQDNDITIGNLEGVVTNLTLKTPKTYNFKFKKEALPYLKKAGFDYLMLTNNHSYDYGEQGFKDTLKAVKETGFATSGAGYNKTEAENFYRTKIKGRDISILSVGAYPVEQSGFNGEKQASATDTRAGVLWKSDKVLEMVKDEKSTGAIVIVNVHAGSEYVKKPNATQTTFYKQLCDSGADVIFGSHPHILQPVEKYNDSLIVWSLGNFVFPGMDGMAGATDTMIIRTGFTGGKLLYYEKYPAKIDGKTVSLVKNN